MAIFRSLRTKSFDCDSSRHFLGSEWFFSHSRWVHSLVIEPFLGIAEVLGPIDPQGHKIPFQKSPYASLVVLSLATPQLSSFGTVSFFQDRVIFVLRVMHFFFFKYKRLQRQHANLRTRVWSLSTYVKSQVFLFYFVFIVLGIELVHGSQALAF